MKRMDVMGWVGWMGCYEMGMYIPGEHEGGTRGGTQEKEHRNFDGARPLWNTQRKNKEGTQGRTQGGEHQVKTGVEHKAA